MTAEDTEIDGNENTHSAEMEVLDFLEGLGPQGISEVSLYRVLPNGKQRFIISGPPGQFSEIYVQSSYGGGDYLVRAKVDGKWFRSKSFSVEQIGSNGNSNGHGSDVELERLRLQIQEQQTRMEAERAAALQRSHEIQLALIQHGTTAGAAPPMSIADMVTAVKSLQDLGGQDQIDKAIERIFSMAAKVNQIQGGGAGAPESWWDWAKPVVAEAGKQLLPRLVPFLNANQGHQPITTAPSVVQPQGMPAAPVLPAPQPEPPVEPAVNAPDEASRFEAEYQAQKADALRFALAMARLNRPPELWADFALEQVDTSNNPVMTRFLSEIAKAEKFETWFAELEKIEPAVITQRPWFDTFYLCIRDSITQREADKPQTSES